MFTMLLMLHLVSTLAMAGLIWFVQVVHYPLFAQVGRDGFKQYEQSHRRLTTIVVAPLMLTEAATAMMLLWLRPDSIPFSAASSGVALVGVLWASTFFWQVPAHERLSQSFDTATHRRLVRSNWLRTVVWTVRGLLACWMILQIVSADGSLPPAVVP